MAEFRITDLMKNRSSSRTDSPKNPPPPPTKNFKEPTKTFSTFQQTPISSEMGIRDYVEIYRRYKWTLLLLLFSGLCVGLILSLKQRPSYSVSSKLIFHNPSDELGESNFKPFIIFSDTVVRMGKNLDVLSATHQEFIKIIEDPNQKLITDQTQKEAILQFWKNLETKYLANFLSIQPQGDQKDILVIQCQLTNFPEIGPLLTNIYSSRLLEYIHNLTVTEYDEQSYELSKSIDENFKEIKSIHLELNLLLDYEDGLKLNNNDSNLSQEIELLKLEQSEMRINLAETNAKIKSMGKSFNLDLETQKFEDIQWIEDTDSTYNKLRNTLLTLNELKNKYPPSHPSIISLENDKKIAESKLYPHKENGVIYIVTNSTNRTFASELRNLISKRESINIQLQQFESQILNIATQILRGSDEQNEINKLSSQLTFLEKYRDSLHKNQRRLAILKTSSTTGYTLLEPAQNIVVINPKPWYITMAISGFVGFCLGITITYMLYNFENTPKYSIDLRRKFAIPILGVIPNWKDSVFLNPQYPSSAQAELYSILRNNIRFCSNNSPEKSIFIYSPSQNDGKSLTAINLAVSFSLEGQRVLLISADLRNANSLVELLPDPKVSIGICEILVDETPFESAIYPSKVKGLDVIPTLNRVNNPTKHLNNRRFAQLLEKMQQKYDVIIVNTPAILPVVDTASCIHLARAVVMVVHAGKTTYSEIKESLKRCSHVGVKTHGIVLNSIKDLSLEKYYGVTHLLKIAPDNDHSSTD
jgi:capsular exopolysaccharide synthesis family protein